MFTGTKFDTFQKVNWSYVKKIKMKRSLSIIIVLMLSAKTWSLDIGSRVENFRLLDHQGQSHELYHYKDKKAVVFLVQGNGCPIVRNAMPRYNELAKTYQEQGVEFFLINSNLQDNRNSIHDEAIQFGYDIPILIDETQIIGESLNLVRTAEVFILDPKTWKVLYHGALDDRLTYENQKAEASNHYLQDAIDSVLGGKQITIAQTNAVGCLINFPEKTHRAKHAAISYEKEIAPILQEN